MIDPKQVFCTHCGSQPGKSCRSDEWGYGRRPTRPHAARIRAADREREKDAALRGEVK